MRSTRVMIRRGKRCALLLAWALAAFALPRAGEAQQVSQVHRRLLMIGVHGAHTALQGADDGDRVALNGWGGRLLVNLAPFSGPGNNLLDNTVVGFFATRASGDGVSVLHTGAEVDLHFVHNPIKGTLDPFVTVGAGRYRVRVDGAESGLAQDNDVSFALSPGLGVRIPLRGLFELRADARDVIVFDSALQDGTAHNLEFTAGVNLRF